MSPAEKDIQEIKADIAEIKKQGKRSAWADIIQVSAVVLLFFFSIEKLADMKKLLK